MSLLAIFGSILTLVQRQNKASQFNIAIFDTPSGYKYKYDASSLRKSLSDADTSKNAMQKFQVVGAADEIIDINSCGYYDFEALPGIGPALAQNIIEYRDSVGRFERVDELLNVRGIGPAKLEMMKAKVTVK